MPRLCRRSAAPIRITMMVRYPTQFFKTRLLMTVRISDILVRELMSTVWLEESLIYQSVKGIVRRIRVG